MEQGKTFYIVEEKALPDVILKVMEAKHLMESGKEKTIHAAVTKAGISRSAFYKYKDSVFPFYENIRGKTLTMSINLDDRQGLLSLLLKIIADEQANVLTISQTIPINKTANVTVTIETSQMSTDVSSLVDKITSTNGIQSLKIIARE